ncbi:MAG TPA: KOW domain-containing RNA-binding protein [bacterium]|nr:KOW domain-containing RNA-binding protein [bacterium]
MNLCLVEKDPPSGLLGRLATSRSGRDAGAVYLVVGAAGPGLVLVADGRTRSVSRPKRKNTKHLDLGGSAPAALASKLATGETVTDEEIRAALSGRAVAK